LITGKALPQRSEQTITGRRGLLKKNKDERSAATEVSRIFRSKDEFDLTVCQKILAINY
jgi:hypothetical protein